MKIGFTNRGIYDISTEYDLLDIVAANNALYISRASRNTGHPLADTDWWQKAINGLQGVTEEELQAVLADYWKKADLTMIPTERIEALD